MSHHGNEVPRGLSEAMKALLGEYPNGRLNENDAGALAVSIGHENGSVVLRFPKLVSWIGFTPEQAIDIAETLVKHAPKRDASRRKRTSSYAGRMSCRLTCRVRGIVGWGLRNR